jgi:flagellar assembly protein FliH
MTHPTSHEKFTFDTEFDGDGAVSWKAPRAKRSFTPEEVEVIRAEAFAEGEQSVVAQAEQAFSAALGQIAYNVEMALPALARVAHDHRSGSTELALACGRKIADAALAKFPEAPVVAALAELAREVEAAPRLTVRIAPDLVERAQQALTELGQAVGFAGALVV